ncbi:MAG: hypothetical protein KJ052_09035 [Candidatus Hydrogenedentes bacterium]|nr:hypothetical protein [Candidatus Hydrogenedentota bacterium]
MRQALTVFGLFFGACLGFTLVFATILGISLLLSVTLGWRPSDLPLVVMGVTFAFFIFSVPFLGVARGVLQKSKSVNQDRHPNQEDLKIMRDIMRGLERMEERTDALETILTEDLRSRRPDREPVF